MNDKPRKKGIKLDKKIASKKQSLVDEASKESFPASDPPPWTLGVVQKKHNK